MDSPFKDINVETVGSPAVDINSDNLSFGDIISGILPYVFGAAGIILVFMIISAGFKLMTSAGDPKATAGAQAQITSAVVGIVVMFVSYWIVKLIMQFFGLDLILFNFS